MDGNSRFGPGDSSFTEIAQLATNEPIGQVDVVKGAASILRVDGTKVHAEAGMQIFQGDTVETEGSGSIGLVFVDKSTFALAENGKMTIDEMVYDPAAAHGNSLYNVTQGVFTFVSGEIAKYSVDAMVIDTPIATIGIRGTAGGGRISNPQLSDPNSTLPPSGTFSNFRDPLTGQSGEMLINTPTGSQVLNTINSTTNVSNPFLPPSTPIIMPAAALKGVFGSSLASLPRPAGTRQTDGGAQGNNAAPGAREESDILTPDAPNEDNAEQQEAVDAAAAAAFAEALAQGLDPGQALEIATQIAEQSSARFGVGGENLDGFSEQNAINDIIGNTLSQSLGGLGGFGPANALAAGSGNITGGNGTDNLVGGAGGDLLGGVPAGQFGPLGNLAALGPFVAPQVILSGFTDNTNNNVVVPSTAPVTTPSSSTNLPGGTQSVTLQSGINDIIEGAAGNDNVTFVSAAQSGDVFNGNGGSDSVTLFNSANTIQVNNVSTLKLAYNETSDISAAQTIQWGTAGSMTLANWDSSTAGPRAPFSLSGVGASGDNNLNQTVTLGFQLNNTNAQNSSFSLSGGTDTVILAVGTNTVAAASGVEVWQLQNGTNTFTLTPAMAGETITGGTGADTVRVSGLGSADTINLGAGADILEVASGSGTPTINGGTTGEGNTFRLTGANTLSDAAFANVTAFDTFEFGSNASISVTAGANFDAAFLSSGDVDVTFTSGITSVTAVFNGANMTSVLNYAGANNAGVDTVTGGSAADIFVTGGGADVVVGGGGNDTFRLAAASDLASGSSYDGGAGTDIFDVAGSIGSIALDFSAVTLASVETFDFSNASQVGATFTSAQLGSISTITGTSGADTLTLSSGGNLSGITVNNFENVVLSGSGVTFADSAASHTITGTAGADSIDISSGGNDAVTTGSGGASVIAGANFDANDSITGVSGTADSLTLAGDYSGGLTLSNITNLDQLTVTDGNSYNVTLTSTTADATNGLSVTGSALTGSNALTVNGTASDDNLTLIGGAGVDTLTGGTANDTILGNGGSDVIDITQGGTDSVTTGTGGATITAGANFTSADTIIGTQGVADTLGLSGDYSGGVSLSNITEIDTINVVDGNSYNFTLAAGSADSTNGMTINGAALTGANALTVNGASSNDVLTLNGGAAADTLTGGSQADIIAAGAGNDTISGGAGNDTFSFATSNFDSSDVINGGADTDKLTLTGGGTLADAVFTNVSNMEQIALDDSVFDLTLSSAAAAAFNNISVTSSQTSNGLTINASGLTTDTLTLVMASSVAADIITGGALADNINTGGGNDNISGGAGNDTITFAASSFDSADTIAGGDGTDKLSLTGGGTVVDSAFTNVTTMEEIQLDDSVYNLTLSTLGDAAFTDFTITSNQTSNALTLDASAASDSVILTMSSSTVADSITGGAGNDIIDTGGGDDTISGGSGHDTITGGAGNDTINGENGNDILNGGDGNDTINGGNGGDIINGGDGNDLLDGGGNGVDTISGGAGNDTLVGGNGNDVLVGGTGSDTFRFEAISSGGGNSNGTDNILGTDFTTGSGGDILDFLTNGMANLGGTESLFSTVTGALGGLTNQGIIVLTDNALGDAGTVAGALFSTILDTNATLKDRVMVWEIDSATVGVGIVSNTTTGTGDLSINKVAEFTGFADQSAVDTFTSGLTVDNFDIS